MKDGIKEAFPDPVLQVKRHERLLGQWLAAHTFNEIPLIPLGVISNPRTIIRTSPTNDSVSQLVIHRDTIPEKMNQLKSEFLKKETNKSRHESNDRLVEKVTYTVQSSSIRKI